MKKNISLFKAIWTAILVSTLAFAPSYQVLAQTSQASGSSSGSNGSRIVPDMKSPEGTSVIYEMNNGRQVRDEVGRSKVYSWIGEKNGVPQYRRGVIETNGSITWSGAYNSRRIGQTQYPNYPEAKIKGADKPIPGNKSLVPMGPVTNVQGGGQSNVNSPSRTYLPEFDPSQRPSALSRAASWTQEHAQLARQQVHEIAKNGINVENGKRLAGEAGTKMFQGATNMGFSAFAFYVALGVTAGYVLMRDYPNDPVAWQNYLDTLSDPVGWASLIGFMVMAGWVYNRFGLDSKKGFAKLRVFAGGLMAGMLVSEAMDTLARDPAFIKCMGFENFKTNLSVRPLEDCDALYDRFTGDEQNSSLLTEILAGFVPMAAGLTAAVPVYLSAQLVFSRGVQLLDKTKLMQWFRTVALAKKPVQGVNGILLNVGSVLLLLGSYAAVDSVFGLQKWIKEQQVASWNLGSHQFGLTLADSETKILNQWKTIKAKNWTDPGNQNFEKTIDRYAKLQGSWRALQMAETQAAYENWRKKGLAYKAFLAEAKEFYKKMLEMIANSPADFTVEKIRAQFPTPPALGENFDGKWKYLNTWRKTDYLLASMACGPEAEGQSASSLFEITRRFLKDNVTGNTSPQKIFEDDLGEAIVFHPPRITRPLEGTNDTVCERTPGPFNPTDILARNPIYSVENLPISLQAGLFGVEQLRYLGLDGVDYRGLPAYIKGNIRDSVFEKGQPSRFDDWWDDRVGTQVDRIEAELEKEYFKMLEDSFKRAIELDSIKWCEVASVPGSGLELQFQKLASRGESCVATKLTRLNRGIFVNLRDELRFYAAMVMDLPLQKMDSGSQAELNAKVLALVATLDQMESHIKKLRLVERQPLEDLGETPDNLYRLAAMQLNELYASTQGNESIENNFQVRWANHLLSKMTVVFAEANKLYGILTAFEKR